MNRKNLKIYALGGDALTSPSNTETAFLAALGGGASGLVCDVEMTLDGVLVCSNDASVRGMNWRDVLKMDAGAKFHSASGTDYPWAGRPKGAALRYPTLERVLILFGRYCPIVVNVETFNEKVVSAVVELLRRYGLDERVKLLGRFDTCQFVSANYPKVGSILKDSENVGVEACVCKAKSIGVSDVCLDWNALSGCHSSIECADLTLWFYSQDEFAPTNAVVDKMSCLQNVGGVIVRGVLPSVSVITPETLVVHDEFGGKRINTELWAAGYSHQNTETVISQDDGLHIAIAEGDKYSGAAAVCLLPIYGRFDAQVDFLSLIHI